MNSVSVHPKIEFLSKPSPVSMDDDWYEIATPDHFWMKWRMQEILKLKNLIPNKDKHFFEIGSGSGTVINQFESLGYNIDGCDLNLMALEMTKETAGQLYVYNIHEKNTMFAEKFDMVLLLDVIEHIDDDSDFLTSSLFHIKKGGKVLVNVPADNKLFSIYDTQVGHIRRYNKKMLRELFEKNNIKIDKISYWGWSLYPIAILRKFYLKFVDTNKIIESGLKPPGKVSNFILNLLRKIEGVFFELPFGTSLIIIGEKK